MIRELAYLGVASARYEDWIAYGTDVLGCQLAPRGADGAVRLRVDDAAHRITVHPGEQDEFRYAGWAFVNEIEQAAYVERLRDVPIAVTAGTPDECRDRGVAGMSWVSDPWALGTSSCGASTAGRAPSGPVARCRASSPTSSVSGTSCWWCLTWRRLMPSTATSSASPCPIVWTRSS